MSMEHDVTGATTEELVIEAREAQRDRRAARIQRVGDHLKREWQLYAMLIPTILWLLIFLYKPMYGLQIAFKDYSIFRGVAGSPWIG
jgi:putative aldouronate transport system permease protein